MITNSNRRQFLETPQGSDAYGSKSREAPSVNTLELGVSMYEKEPSMENVSMSKLQDICIVRLKALKEIAENYDDGSFGNENGSERLNSLCLRQEYKDLNNPELDCLSHHFVRWAFLQNNEMAEWFIKQEARLFLIRLHNKLELGFICPPNIKRKGATEFFSAPFEDAISLFPAFKGHLEAGQCIFHKNDLKQVLTTIFRKGLRKSIEPLKPKYELILSFDPRIEKFLKSLPSIDFASDYMMIKSNSERNPKNLGATDIEDIASSNHLPPCMEIMQKHLKTKHHLRHFGRLQFGLFLKGIGMGLEEAIKFWKQEFMKGMSEDQFNKGYLYNLKHMYGKEGKNTDYSPWSCDNIITKNLPCKLTPTFLIDRTKEDLNNPFENCLLFLFL